MKDIRAVKQSRGFSGIPITDTGRIGGALLGIVCTRDIDFVGDDDLSVTEVMTRDVIVAKEGCTLSQANELMKSSKKGKLPIVNEKGHLVALISRTDLLKVPHGLLTRRCLRVFLGRVPHHARCDGRTETTPTAP